MALFAFRLVGKHCPRTPCWNSPRMVPSYILTWRCSPSVLLANTVQNFVFRLAEDVTLVHSDMALFAFRLVGKDCPKLRVENRRECRKLALFAFRLVGKHCPNLRAKTRRGWYPRTLWYGVIRLQSCWQRLSNTSCWNSPRMVPSYIVTWRCSPWVLLAKTVREHRVENRQGCRKLAALFAFRLVGKHCPTLRVETRRGWYPRTFWNGVVDLESYWQRLSKNPVLKIA